MQVRCRYCFSRFDDADRSTICPHELIMPAEDLVQKKLGLALLEKRIRFKHMPEEEPLRVQSIGWNGMVTLHGMSGEFAPHLFMIEQEESDAK